MKKEKKNIIDDGFRADLVLTAEFAGIFEIPRLKKPTEFIIPKDTIPFSIRNQSKDHSEFIIFYEHDIKFADILTATDEYLEELRSFPGIISPDCSLYRDMPLNLQIANTYMNRAVAHYLESQGIYVIPNVRWGDERSYSSCVLPEKFAFVGIPKHSIVSIGTYGCIQSKEDKHYIREGVRAMLDELEPKIVLVYGPMPPKIFNEFKDKTQFIHYSDWISKKKGVK